MDDRCWPTDQMRPGETVADYCRRIDVYENLKAGSVLVVGTDVETFDTPEEMVGAWQEMGRPEARMLKGTA